MGKNIERTKGIFDVEYDVICILTYENIVK